MSDSSHETRERGAADLGPAGGILLAAGVLVCVDAALIALRLPRPASLAQRALHHAVDASHLVVAATLAAILAGLWQRSTRRARSVVAAVAIALVAAIGVFAVADDLGGALARARVPRWTSAPLGAALLVAGVAFAAVLGRLVARPWLRFVGLGLGTALAAANGLLLPFDYPGIHLGVAFVSVALIAASASTLPRPAFTRNRPALGAAFALALAATTFTVLRPPPDVWRDLQSLPSAVFAPYLGELRAWLRIAVARRELGGWWQARGAGPATPPTGALALPKNPIVLLLTIDCMRADALSEGTRALLPTMHALADEGVHFTVARAPSPSTSTSFASLFTGRYYSQLRWEAEDQAAELARAYSDHRDTSPRFVELLRDVGQRTVIVASLHGFVTEVGPARGFTDVRKTAKDYGYAEEVVDLLLGELAKDAGRGGFYFAHFLDAHAPYSAAGTHGTPHERYLRELSLVDAQLARLRRKLAELDLEERTTIVLSADHGEAFGEHNTVRHAATLYEELLRVPLVVAGPGVVPRKLDVPVSLVDVGPTILDLYGLPTPHVYMGESFAPALVGRDFAPTRPIAAESGRRLQALVFADGFKAIVDQQRQTEEVYDLRADPLELRNLAGDDEHMHRVDLLRAFFSAHEHVAPGYSTPTRRF